MKGDLTTKRYPIDIVAYSVVVCHYNVWKNIQLTTNMKRSGTLQLSKKQYSCFIMLNRMILIIMQETLMQEIIHHHKIRNEVHLFHCLDNWWKSGWYCVNVNSEGGQENHPFEMICIVITGCSWQLLTGKNSLTFWKGKVTTWKRNDWFRLSC